MARAHVSHNLGDLQYDLERGPVDLYQGGGKIVGSAAREGGQTARRIAQWTSGQHAKKYPNSITWDRAPQTYLGFGGGQIKPTTARSTAARASSERSWKTDRSTTPDITTWTSPSTSSGRSSTVTSPS